MIIVSKKLTCKESRRVKSLVYSAVLEDGDGMVFVLPDTGMPLIPDQMYRITIEKL